MTDKQIIIDGVDITNCIHRATNKLCGDINPYCRCYTGSCKDISNCNYKQLKRKEQECEELKVLNNRLNSALGYRRAGKKTFIDLSVELDQLKAENDELKKIIERLDVPKHEVIDMNIALENEKLRTENEELREQLELNTANAIVIDMAQRLYKLKQTLTEIKEIGKKSMREGKMLSGGWLYQFIEQKISEVENDR